IAIEHIPRPALPAIVPVHAVPSDTDSSCCHSPTLPQAQRIPHAALPRYLSSVLGRAAPPAPADSAGDCPVQAARHLGLPAQSGSPCPPAPAPRTGPAITPRPAQTL